MTEVLWGIVACGVLALAYSAYTIRSVMAADAGTARMQEIAGAIREGAQAYLNRQYTTIAMVGAVIFVLAWILVVYLLIEAEPTYRWVRGFVVERLRPRFDRTAEEAAAAARGYVIGNVTTSVCAAVYFYIWLEVLHVPAALLLALLAFVADFIPVVGFFLSCLPAMAMAATQSSATALAMVPIYLTYHVIENYILTPRVYAGRLRLSNLAVLLALAVGAELAGVMGALVALPVAAVYPTIERLWLREAFGDEVIEEHRAITADHRPRHAS